MDNESEKTPGDLPGAWRERAAFLRDYGDATTARVWEVASAELEQAIRSTANGTLNLQEAAKESGYSSDHLGELVREGKLPNAGRRNAPRIRRADLPIKKPVPLRSPSKKSRDDALRIATKLR